MKRALALGLLLLWGCVFTPSTRLPEDFEVYYSTGGCHAEWGRTNILIDAQGNGIYEKGSGALENGRFQNEEFRLAFRMGQEERLALLNEIEESGFFSLSGEYFNPDIVDGSCSSISVTRNGETKTVSVSNMQPPGAFTASAEAISSAAQSKTK